MSLYEKRLPVALVDDAEPTGSAATSSELDIANEPMAVVHVLYTATGTGKVLRLYPEVRLAMSAGEVWVPALSASFDVSGATVDDEGYLPLDGASPVLDVPGIGGQEVAVTLHVPVPTGDRFRLRYAEDGYSGHEPGHVSVYAAAARGAS